MQNVRFKPITYFNKVTFLFDGPEIAINYDKIAADIFAKVNLNEVIYNTDIGYKIGKPLWVEIII